MVLGHLPILEGLEMDFNEMKTFRCNLGATQGRRSETRDLRSETLKESQGPTKERATDSTLTNTEMEIMGITSYCYLSPE